jgi:hypothetical protein
MRQIKAPIAGNSKAIAKIGNAELAHFNKQMLIHELIRGSLVVTKNDNLFDTAVVVISLVTVNVFEAMLFFVDVARIAVVGIVG